MAEQPEPFRPEIGHVTDKDGKVYQEMNAEKTDWDEAATAQSINNGIYKTIITIGGIVGALLVAVVAHSPALIDKALQIATIAGVAVVSGIEKALAGF